MKVLVACEESGEVRDAFIKLGHDAISCDLKPARNGGPHYQGSVFDIINDGFDLMIAHPPCTYLCVTSNKWFKDQPKRKSGALVGAARRKARREAARRKARREAAKFFMALANSNIPMICLENPVGVMSTLYKKPDQIIQPFQFGHPEPKKTCLWLKGLPLLQHTKIVKPAYHISKSGKRLAKWYYYADKSKGQAHRAEIRSKTFSGIAKAMAQQWGKTK